MKKFPLVLDLETKYTFRNFSDPKKLGVSVVAIYDYKKGKGEVFLEEEVNKLFPYLEESSYLIGYNIREFDLPVLQAYYPGNIFQFATLDILEEIKNKIGKRLALNDILASTLGKKKSGHGLMAIDYYKEGKVEELKRYCLDDVMLTKELFDFGVEKGEIYYPTISGKGVIKVNWKGYLEGNGNGGNISMTLPF